MKGILSTPRLPVVAIIILMLALSVPPAFADGANTWTVPLQTKVYSPCDGNSVTFTGDGRVEMNVTATPSGNFVYVYHLNVHMTSADGRNVFNLAMHTGILNAGASMTLTSRNALLVTKGAGPNLRTDMDTRLVINANGEPTVDISTSNTACTG